MEIPGYLENWLKMFLSTETPTRKGEASKNSKGQEYLVLKKKRVGGGGRRGRRKSQEIIDLKSNPGKMLEQINRSLKYLEENKR